MTRPRFFVRQDLTADEEVALQQELAHRATRVLRLRPGDRVVLFDGSGIEAEGEIASTGRYVVVRILRRHHPRREASIDLVLFQALLANERFEVVLEKCTELGVKAFVPVVCGRCTARPPRDQGVAAKLARWRAVTVAAAEQSGRVRLPEVKAPVRFEEAIVSSRKPVIMAWERARQPLQPVLETIGLERPAAISLFVGPEGGFTEEEALLAQSSGAEVVSLGPRILRADTAAVALVALTLFAVGAFAPSDA